MAVKRGEAFAVGELPLTMGELRDMGELLPRMGELAGASYVPDSDPTVDTLKSHSEYHSKIHNSCSNLGLTGVTGKPVFKQEEAQLFKMGELSGALNVRGGKTLESLV